MVTELILQRSAAIQTKLIDVGFLRALFCIDHAFRSWKRFAQFIHVLKRNFFEDFHRFLEHAIIKVEVCYQANFFRTKLYRLDLVLGPLR